MLFDITRSFRITEGLVSCHGVYIMVEMREKWGLCCSVSTLLVDDVTMRRNEANASELTHSDPPTLCGCD